MFVAELFVRAVPGRVGRLTVDEDGAPHSSSSGLWYTIRWRCVYLTSGVLRSLLLAVLVWVALGLSSLLLSLLSVLFKSFDRVRLNSLSIVLCLLIVIGPESISICQCGLTEPGAACVG
jgi:hypothetical protein